MKTLVTDGEPKERITVFFEKTPRYAQYTIAEIAAGTDLPVRRVTGAVTSLLQQGRLAREERAGSKYFRWMRSP